MSTLSSVGARDCEMFLMNRGSSRYGKLHHGQQNVAFILKEFLVSLCFSDSVLPQRKPPFIGRGSRSAAFLLRKKVGGTSRIDPPDWS